MRVGVIGSEAETLDFYNLINNSNESSLGNFGGGQKSGGGGGK